MNAESLVRQCRAHVAPRLLIAVDAHVNIGWLVVPGADGARLLLAPVGEPTLQEPRRVRKLALQRIRAPAPAPLRGLGPPAEQSPQDAVDEARLALTDVFLRVKGPSHLYMEQFPADWPMATVRRVVELRDDIQKKHLRHGVLDLFPILQAMQRVENAAVSPA